MASTAGRDITPGQEQALLELREIAAEDPAAFEILEVEQLTTSGHLPILISVGTSGAGQEGLLTQTGPRARIRARERFRVLVPASFPFEYPLVLVQHDRFAGLPHVQWRRSICLYVSPTTEWQPSDGMFGFLERLLKWIERAAAGALDPAGEPLHPPAVYPTTEGGAVVVRADAPLTTEEPWLGIAVLRRISQVRVDLVDWADLSDAQNLLYNSPADVASKWLEGEDRLGSLVLGLAVLLPKPTQYEYPVNARALVDILAGQGISKDSLISGLALLALLNNRFAPHRHADEAEDTPIFMVVGAPMRGMAGGERRQHLAVWRLSELGRDIVRLLDNVFSDYTEQASVGEKAKDLLSEWLDVAGLDWARVYEERPEVSTRRDAGSPLEEIRGKHVMLLGCGAIGGHAAEYLVRAGVACLTLVDNGRVSPGVLVRQPYDDSDIHRPKAEALAAGLHRMRPDLNVRVIVGDARKTVLADDELRDVDLIIDAAANAAVTALLERRRRDWPWPRPSIVTMLLGHRATRAMTTVAPSDYTGSGIDLMRKVKVAVFADPDLDAFAEDFFPDPPRSDYFQPEPGCSEATFVGADADVAALTATLLTHSLSLWRSAADSARAAAVLVDLGLDTKFPAKLRHIWWPADVVHRDTDAPLEIRISPSAFAEVRAECRLMARRRGSEIETGGILLGEIDDACGIAWVSAATGPPPDSRASARAFICGVDGVEELITSHDRASGGALRFVGMWHCHPFGSARPSPVDDEGMRELVTPLAQAPRRALLLIIGGRGARWESWLNSSDAGSVDVPPELFVHLCHRTSVRGATSTTPTALYLAALSHPNSAETRRWPSARERADRRVWPWVRWWRS
ncbi:MAG: ThiF family adenylyltransferase [Dehalococcoidia bacterium]